VRPDAARDTCGPQRKPPASPGGRPGCSQDWVYRRTAIRRSVLRGHGLEPIEEYVLHDPDGEGGETCTWTLAREFIWGARFPEPLVMVDWTAAGDVAAGSEEVLHYVRDALGSVVGLLDAGEPDATPEPVPAKLVERYDYDPYGKTYIAHWDPAAGSGSGDWVRHAADEPSAFGNPFMWTGQRHDVAIGLYHFPFRTYSPRLGRWLQRDPLGYVDGVSLVQYCISSPTRYVDPLGLVPPDGADRYIEDQGRYLNDLYQKNEGAFWQEGAARATVILVGAVVGAVTLVADAALATEVAWEAGKKALGNDPEDPGGTGVDTQDNPEPEDTGPTERLYHKGELKDGEVDPNKALSTGTDRESVDNLNRKGEVHEFEVPKKKLYEWEEEGTVRRLKDLDQETGTQNDEIRILPPRSGEMNKYKKDTVNDNNTNNNSAKNNNGNTGSGTKGTACSNKE
jgi:RHS repeat-associated protein